MTVSANEGLEGEGVGASNAEVATQQGQASQQDGNDAQSRSAHILPTPADSDELRTQGLSVIAAARESVADAAGNALRVGDRSKHLQAALEPLRSEIYHAMLSDLGLSENGPQRPTETQRMTVRNLASLDVLAETFWTWIAERGVLTSKARRARPSTRCSRSSTVRRSWPRPSA